MEQIVGIFNYISDLGKYIIIPITVAIIGLIFKCEPEKAVKGGIVMGVGLFGLDLAMGLVFTYVSPIASALLLNANIHKDIIDVGWAASAGIAYSTSLAAFIISLPPAA